jgi:hypothetical protein
MGFKQLKFGHWSEFAAQIGILATIASSISILEIFNQSSGYCPGEGWVFSVRMEVLYQVPAG